jgi:hypothetical protein
MMDGMRATWLVSSSTVETALQAAHSCSDFGPESGENEMEDIFGVVDG